MTTEITHLRSEDLLEDPARAPRQRLGGLGRRRRLAGLALAAVLLPLLTLALDAIGTSLSLESQVLLYLLAVAVIAFVGGIVPAIIAALAGAFCLNYFFVRPFHTLEVSQGEQALALAIFLIVALLVSGAVEIAARRGRREAQAARHADALAELTGPDLERDDTLKGVLTRARTTFGMESVLLLARKGASGEWAEVDQAGWAPEGTEAALQFDIAAGDRLRLVGRGPSLFAEDQRVLEAFAAAAQTAYEARELSANAASAREWETSDRQRSALLAAVGHDLRTPLAAIKASASSLRQTDVEWSAADRADLLATVEDSVDELSAIVANLLDASRLEAGALSVDARPVALDQCIGAAVLSVPGARGRVNVDVPDDLPLVLADAGLLERILANLLANAIQHTDDGSAIEVSALAGDSNAKLKVVDHGPGVPAHDRERLFEPFEQGRRDGGGVGLGLSVARGFTEAMGGALIADESDGGGLTMRLRIPLAP